MEQFKEESKKRKPLIPPQDPKYAGKLTVVLEMDEILFYTFVPDEHEAYINAPLRYTHTHINKKGSSGFVSVLLKWDNVQLNLHENTFKNNNEIGLMSKRGGDSVV